MNRRDGDRPAIGDLDLAIARHDLSDGAKKLLKELALDPHGMPRSSAQAMVAPFIASTNASSAEVLLELYGKQLICEDCSESEPRIQANYSALGLNDVQRLALLSPTNNFNVIGRPHSPEAMNALHQFFAEDDIIYLLLGVTSPEVFDALDSRAIARRHTVFLFPAKRFIPSHLLPHYQEVLTAWIHRLRDGPRYLRDHVVLRLATAPSSNIFTTALSASVARININRIASPSTRTGTMVTVDRTSTLYQLFLERVRAALRSSRPLFHLSPWRSVGHYFARAAWPVTLAAIGIACATFTNVASAVISTVAIGMFAIWLSDVLQVKRWTTYYREQYSFDIARQQT